MWKPPLNPQVLKLTQTSTKRQISVSRLRHVIRPDGTKGCIWCGDPLKSNHHATRYCNDGLCPSSTYAWAYPQKEEGLQILLIRQDYCCRACGYDYKPFLLGSVIGQYYGTKNADLMKLNSYLVKRLKRHIEPHLKPEVDHIIPIAKGGMSLGLDNHQVLCYSCHKAKTKVDNSGPRRK